METQADVLEAQTISHRHASGEVFEAQNIESAYIQCTGLVGKISLEEFGLLVELEAMGKEEAAKAPSVQVEKLTIKQLEKKSLPVNENIKASSAAVPPITQEAMRIPDTHSTALEDIVLPEPLRLAEEGQAEVSSFPAVEVKEVAKPVEVAVPETPDSPSGLPVSTKVHTETTSQSQELKINSQEEAQPIHLAIHEEASELVVELPVSGHVLPTRLPEQPADLLEGVINNSDEILHEELEPADAEPIVFDLPELSQEVSDETEITLSYDTPEVTDQVVAEALHILPEESISATISVELPAPLVQVEAALTSLAEAIEEADEERTEIIQRVFKEILALPSETEQGGVDKEKITEQKLEELFVELFESLDIDYSSELITSFVRLTRTHYLDELIEQAQEVDEEPSLPDDVGTREFLQQLQHALVVIKQTTVRLCELGKSALKLYGQRSLLAIQ